jgi:hypothetical protein
VLIGAYAPVSGSDKLIAMRKIMVLLSMTVMIGAQPAKAPPPKSTAKSKSVKSPTVTGFAVTPPVLADEGCARDYMRMFQTEGVEQRKKFDELIAYHCLDGTAKGIFSATATERKDFAVAKGEEAFFRLVAMIFDKNRTQNAIGGPNVFLISPPSGSYLGWIPEQDFYPVRAEQFDEMVAAGKIRIRIVK